MQRILVWAAPGIFVVLWSTGFIGARLGLPYSEPFTFLFIRFALVIMILVPVCFVFEKQWPSANYFLRSMVVGVLLHVAYLGGVFFAIDRGMSAGVSALIVSLQPIITLLLARIFLGDKTARRTVVLFLIGLLGVALVILPRLGGGEITLPASTLFASAVALAGISIGTIYQKQIAVGISLLTGLAAQYVGATLVLGILAWFTETMHVTWTGEFIFALSWLIFVLSLGAVGLLMFLISQQSVARVSALFFLVPGFTLIVANILFGETMSYVQIIGLIIASGAVAAVNYQRKLQ